MFFLCWISIFSSWNRICAKMSPALSMRASRLVCHLIRLIYFKESNKRCTATAYYILLLAHLCGCSCSSFNFGGIGSDCVWVEKYWTTAATAVAATSVLSLIYAYPSPYIDCHAVYVSSYDTYLQFMNIFEWKWTHILFHVTHSIGFPLKRAAAFCDK